MYIATVRGVKSPLTLALAPRRVGVGASRSGRHVRYGHTVASQLVLGAECGHSIGCRSDEPRGIVKVDLALRLKPKLLLRGCADRLAAFHICRFLERSNRLFIAH